MAIRDASLQRAIKSGNLEKARLLRKANQEWDLAGMARNGNDKEDEAKHTEQAREYTRQARELD